MYCRGAIKLDTRNIIVTGCSSGIGDYCVRQLVLDGWNVFASARKPEDIDKLMHDGIEACYLDYSEADSIETFFAQALKYFDCRIDALYNNGGYCQPGAVEDLCLDALRRQFEANFFGWFVLTQKTLVVMRAQGHGRIVCTSSLLGMVPIRWLGAYNASKHALEGLMLSLAMELSATNIKVSLIEPGQIVSKVGLNAVLHLFKHVDIANSNFRGQYKKQLKSLLNISEKGGYSIYPDAVYKALEHALSARRPRYQYSVSNLTRIVLLIKRVLPSELLYKLIVKVN